MAGMKEIRTHIKSVEQTLKITNAMYLLASANLRKARERLAGVEPYFRRIESTITDILEHSPDVEHRFFDQRPRITVQSRRVGFVVITGDKGLAGSYNHSSLRLAERHITETPNPIVFPVGQVGRTYFSRRGIPVEEAAFQTAQNPAMWRARDLSEELILRFAHGELDEVCVLYTDMRSALHLEPTLRRLLPLTREGFSHGGRERARQSMTYLPSVEAVMDLLVAEYVKGELFGAMTESYCSEQNARMAAMKSSSDSARELLRELGLSLNQARQAAITQEITEIVGGAQAAQ